jgi:catalase
VEIGNAGVKRPSERWALHLRAVICSPVHATGLGQRTYFLAVLAGCSRVPAVTWPRSVRLRRPRDRDHDHGRGTFAAHTARRPPGSAGGKPQGWREKITHFDHERISERVVPPPRGAGVYGYFHAYESQEPQQGGLPAGSQVEDAGVHPILELSSVEQAPSTCRQTSAASP